jgi:general secretion pathway protein G
MRVAPAALPALRRAAAGFTLLELLVTASIVATLAMIALPLAELTVKRNREAELLVALRDIRSAIDAYKQAVDDGRLFKEVADTGYPPRLDLLVEGVENVKDPKKARIYFMRRLPRDPMHADPAVPAAQTWGLRSYDSPPDDPVAGKDVFDVYSLSTGVGLNGIPYRKW